jgi:alpha-amylase
VGGNGYVTITLPSNAFSRGVSFGLFAPGGVNHQVANPPMSTTQIYIGAQGEDIPALHEGAYVLPQRIYCASGTTIEAVLTIDPADMTNSSSIYISLREPSGAEVASGSIGSGSHAATISGKTREDGWHSLTLTGGGVADEGVKFSLSVKYRGLA